MAIRLKNREEMEQEVNQEERKAKRKKVTTGRIVVWALSLAAGLIFMSLYPWFQERAAEEEPDILSGNEFLHEIYQANTVLYRILQETVTGTKIDWQDLYLTAAKSRVNDYRGEYYDFGEETPLSYAGERLGVLLDDWNTNMAEGIASVIDYEIIDGASGKRIANTEWYLCRLGTENESQTAKDFYPYYIKMEFDDIGKLSHVWVRGEDADALLEATSRVMKSRYLERNLYETLSYSAYGNVGWEDEIYYLSEGELWRMLLRVTNLPKNCTVCYAMSEAQLAELKASSRMFLSMTPVGNYLNSGIQEAFRLLLIMLFLMALLLPLWKGYHLHEKQLLPLHFEIRAVLLAAAFLLLGELSAWCVLYTMSNRWDHSLPYILQIILPGLYWGKIWKIVQAGNLILLTVAFRFWLALATPFCQIYVFGVRGYFRKHSLLVRCARKMRVVIKRRRRRLRRMHWQKKYGYLVMAVRSVYEGNLQTEFSEDWGDFEPLKEELASLQTAFLQAVEEEVKSQRMRNELITNVSHDLKTPLTAILTYTELLQGKNVTEQQRGEYLSVLRRKSLRLKTLIEDLFEVSKASSGNVTLERERVDICSLMRQVYLEYEDGAKVSGLTFRFQFPDEKIYLLLDGEKTCRIFDNLYANILKYAMPDTRVYVSVVCEGEEVRIELKNVSGTELNIPPESLTERFVRGDSARSSEGSGLGLAIARSFVELQDGRMQIEIDGDLFKVTLIWLQQD